MNDDKDQSRPTLKIAAESSQENIEEYAARQGLGDPLRALAANLIRVVRGAGEPYQIGYQCIAVIEALKTYYAAVGSYPTNHELHDALQLTYPVFDGDDRDWAMAEMTRGGLRIAAADLLRQRLQIIQGRKDLMEGFNQMDHWRKEQRRIWEEARRLTARKKPKRKPPGDVKI